MSERREPPEQPPLLAGNSRTSLPLYCWGIICGLTMGLSVLPAVEFVTEVAHRRGWTAPAILLVISYFCALFTSKLQQGYFEIRPWESDGRLYERLGVRLFRFVVPMGDCINWFVRRFQPDYRVVSEQSVADFIKRTETAERFHLACLLAIAPSALYSILLQWWAFAMLLTLPNIVLHVYPILLQRYTRARIQRLRRAR